MLNITVQREEFLQCKIEIEFLQLKQNNEVQKSIT